MDKILIQSVKMFCVSFDSKQVIAMIQGNGHMVPR